MADVARLFIGLEVPDDVRDALSRVAHEVPGARWVRREQLHITLAFLGNVAPAVQARLREALREVRVSPFDVQVKGVGAFGGATPRVLWAGLASVPRALTQLHDDVGGAIRLSGVTAERESFRPHVTLARLRDARRRDVQPFLDRYAQSAFGQWSVTEFVLFRSVLSPRGSTYLVDLRV